jgi:predicted transcriptional regulator
MDTTTLSADLPTELAERLDRIARGLGMSPQDVLHKALSAWLAWEEEKDRLTLEAVASAEAGDVVDDEAVRAWIDSIGTDHELPRPG